MWVQMDIDLASGDPVSAGRGACMGTCGSCSDSAGLRGRAWENGSLGPAEGENVAQGGEEQLWLPRGPHN